MHQICDGYNPRALMGNWYQQTFSVPQPARDQPIKIARKKQVDIGFIDNKGKLRQLNTVSRLQPWNTDKLVSAPQYNENKCNNKSVMKQNFDLTIAKNHHKQWKPHPFTKQNGCNLDNKTYVQVNKFNKNHRLFNQRNINQLLNQRSSDQTSFKSSIKPNTHLQQKQLLQTIYQMQTSQPAQFYATQKDSNFTATRDFKTALDESQKSVNFRRIRSEITLKTTTNFPFTMK